MQPQEYEIGFMDIAELIWQGKWILMVFLIISLSTAMAYINKQEPEYKAYIFYDVELYPPIHSSSAQVRSDFEKQFHNVKNFEGWKKNNPNSVLELNDFKLTEEIEGIIISRQASDLLVKINSNSETETFFIRANTGNLKLLNDVYTYAQNINSKVTESYAEKVKSEVNLIQAINSKSINGEQKLNLNILPYQRYLLAYQDGQKALFISRPTKPEKISPNGKLILLASAAVGGILGFFTILFKNASKSRERIVDK